MAKGVNAARAAASALRRQPENAAESGESVRLDQDGGGIAPDQTARKAANRLAVSAHCCDPQLGADGEVGACAVGAQGRPVRKKQPGHHRRVQVKSTSTGDARHEERQHAKTEFFRNL